MSVQPGNKKDKRIWLTRVRSQHNSSALRLILKPVKLLLEGGCMGQDAELLPDLNAMMRLINIITLRSSKWEGIIFAIKSPLWNGLVVSENHCNSIIKMMNYEEQMIYHNCSLALSLAKETIACGKFRPVGWKVNNPRKFNGCEFAVDIISAWSKSDREATIVVGQRLWRQSRYFHLTWWAGKW